MKKPRLYTVLLLCSVILVSALYGITQIDFTDKSNHVDYDAVSTLSSKTEEVIDNKADIQLAEQDSSNPQKPDPSPSVSAVEETPSDIDSIPSAIPSIGAVDDSYFQDALFIGDSRTVGLSEYAGLENASFFADVGLNVFKLKEISVQYEDEGSFTLEELLSSHTFGKIYLMLGINELGYSQSATVEQYTSLINRIRELQPNAFLLLEANLRVSSARSNEGDYINNSSIDSINTSISALADNKSIFYLDVNPLFDDGSGNLRDDYTSDGVHVYGKYYSEWGNWLRENGLVFSE